MDSNRPKKKYIYIYIKLLAQILSGGRRAWGGDCNGGGGLCPAWPRSWGGHSEGGGGSGRGGQRGGCGDPAVALQVVELGDQQLDLQGLVLQLLLVQVQSRRELHALHAQKIRDVSDVSEPVAT